MEELQKFTDQIDNLNKSTSALIKHFIELNNSESVSDIFPGWHLKLNMAQYKIMQRLFHRQKYKTTSNKFIFDIESNKYGEKQIVQIAYYVIDNNMNVIDHDMYYVFNKGVYSDYYNKIKYQTLKEFGISPNLLFDKLQYVLSQCDILIGHNITTFDCKIVTKYFERRGLMLDLTTKKCYDTMKESRHVTNLKNKKGSSKWATLTELSEFFGIESNCDTNFHDALYDVHITYLCYINLIKIT